MSAEQWRPVLGWEGLYDVSDQGRVRSSEGRRQPSVIRTPDTSRNGYQRVAFSAPGRRERRLVHRVVLEALIGPCPDGMVACHNNAVRDDNRLANLRWDTPEANVQDTVRMRTHKNSRKTHCPSGHAYDEANTYLRQPGGWRMCRACGRADERRARAARNERAA